MREDDHAVDLFQNLRVFRIIRLHLEGLPASGRDLDMLRVDRGVVVEVFHLILELCFQILVHLLVSGYDAEGSGCCDLCLIHSLFCCHGLVLLFIRIACGLFLGFFCLFEALII